MKSGSDLIKWILSKIPEEDIIASIVYVDADYVDDLFIDKSLYEKKFFKNRAEFGQYLSSINPRSWKYEFDYLADGDILLFSENIPGDFLKVCVR